MRNQIPDKAVAGADIRLTVADGLAKTAGRAEREGKDKTHPRYRNHGDHRARAGRLSWPATHGRALAREGQAIYAEIGRTLDIVEMTGGATDASFASRSGKAIVVESFGLAGFGYHARDEYIDTSSIVPRLYLMTRMLTELGKRK